MIILESISNRGLLLNRRLVGLTLSAVCAVVSSCTFYSKNQPAAEATPHSSAEPRYSAKVAADLKLYDQTVDEMNQQFASHPVNIHDPEWAKAKLSQMYKVDQYMRDYLNVPYENKYNEAENKEFQEAFSKRFNALDRANTADMKELLKVYPWFTISKFDKVADLHAWILVQHADLDPDFQKHVLEILKPLVPGRETDPAHYAYLVDRVQSSFLDPSQRVPQTYGTQGSCVAPGKWEPLPSREPDQLDKRRAEVGLGPEAEYFKMFKDICH